jgi:hypothetical protein
MKRFSFALIAIIALLSVAAAEDKTAVLNFTVIKDTNGKPVRNAYVILHPVNKEGKQEKTGVELKTDSDGKTSFPGAPYGKLRIQVIATGFQTYGEDFDINQPEHEITIKLKRPADQYSIYK